MVSRTSPATRSASTFSPSASSAAQASSENGAVTRVKVSDDAIPFLGDADKVTVLSIERPGRPDPTGEKICDFLSKHDVNVDLRTNINDNDASVGEIILDVGRELDCDSLVMGAYGHSRLRELIIGGVTIPYHLGLLGHSDADVLLHAITDALLGAAALGDIGKHFPDTAADFKGADSRVLLRAAAVWWLIAFIWLATAFISDAPASTTTTLSAGKASWTASKTADDENLAPSIRPSRRTLEGSAGEPDREAEDPLVVRVLLKQRF